MAAKVISVVNNKGGVGKTTSTAFFGDFNPRSHEGSDVG